MEYIDNDKLNNWILRYYPNFRFKYWSTTNYPEIESYIKNFMFNSFLNSIAREQNNPNEKYKREQLRRELPEIIHMMEDFFAAALGTRLFHDGNISKILNNMKNICEYIEFLPEEYSGVYGRTSEKDKCVQINSNMRKYSGRQYLTPDEVRRLYVFHELGHTILNIKGHPMIEQFYSTYSNVMAQKGKNVPKPEVPQLIGAGFLMIEECLTQEMAETFAYYIANKRRPKYTVHKDLGAEIETNMDYYGIFQKPTINLGTTLRGCGSKENSSNEAILEGMLKRALNHDFVPDLISEYDQAYNGSPDAYEDLMHIIIEMGIICDKKYRAFGENLVKKPYTGSVLQALSSIQNRTRKYQDFRGYPQNGFNYMNFDHPNTQRRQQLLETISAQRNTVSELRNEEQSLLDRRFRRNR